MPAARAESDNQPLAQAAPTHTAPTRLSTTSWLPRAPHDKPSASLCPPPRPVRNKDTSTHHDLRQTMMMLRPVLLKFLTAFCALPGCVTAATAPTAPVMCGRPGGCAEAAAGLKPVDELHEVRLHSASTYHVLV